MKMIIASVASILTTVLIGAMTLGAMFSLVEATDYVTSLESTLQRASAMGAASLLGVALLLPPVWLATHLALRIFSMNQRLRPAVSLVSAKPPRVFSGNA